MKKTHYLILLAISILIPMALTAQTIGNNHNFVNGKSWPDASGNHINAHGGNIINYKGTYYWYGECRPDHGGSTEKGIAVYSSKDLRQWYDKGIALSTSSESGHDIERGCIMERPKVVYCEKTGKFVMLFHLELKGKGYAAARVAFAVADNPEGPFTFLRSQRIHAGKWPMDMTVEQQAKAMTHDASKWEGKWWTPEWRKAVAEGMYLWKDFKGGQMSRDMTVYIDDDGKAYHITSSQENLTLVVSELTDDMLDYTGRYNLIAPGGQNEAPVIFKRNGTYWLICSGCTGWAPNEARMFSSKSIWGPWQQHPTPFSDAEGKGYKDMGAEKTFGAQGTSVLTTPEGKLLFMADIWNPRSLSNSLHLWLPVRFAENESGEMPVITWSDDPSL